MPLFVGHAEVVPAGGGIGEGFRRGLRLAALLKQQRPVRRDDVLVQGQPRRGQERLDPLCDPSRQLDLSTAESSPHSFGERVHDRDDCARLRDAFGQQLQSSLLLAQRKWTTEAPRRA